MPTFSKNYPRDRVWAQAPLPKRAGVERSHVVAHGSASRHGPAAEPESRKAFLASDCLIGPPQPCRRRNFTHSLTHSKGCIVRQYHSEGIEIFYIVDVIAATGSISIFGSVVEYMLAKRRSPQLRQYRAEAQLETTPRFNYPIADYSKSR